MGIILVPTEVFIRGVADDGKRYNASLVSRSKHKRAEAGITERRVNSRARGSQNSAFEL